ncbi:DUF2691 family protein [Psychrobacillus vulpis]|uniref:DUF2691 family protein n=1 Tax=Psychrobacillus vulpis TaxID=2325572 RepID=A0A544TKP2_9BACI|nr:DUF2691 family protein [Psychrobacillus vulpis]TQR18013.1 DUF2691 family protein [Psychrobacillus vulpis]
MLGLLFEMKNKFGKQLSDILVDIVDPSWCWSIGSGEAHSMEIPDPDFLPPNVIMEGEAFFSDISTGKYYVIFADLKAFPTREDVVEVKNYEEFLKSSCQLALLVIDSVYVSIVLKEQQMVHKFFERAEALGYTNIKFLTDENKTSLLFNVWG